MSGKHYKGQEVSCCIKYFIFGFNIIFWVRALCLHHHFFVYMSLFVVIACECWSDIWVFRSRAQVVSFVRLFEMREAGIYCKRQA